MENVSRSAASLRDLVFYCGVLEPLRTSVCPIAGVAARLQRSS